MTCVCHDFIQKWDVSFRLWSQRDSSDRFRHLSNSFHSLTCVCHDFIQILGVSLRFLFLEPNLPTPLSFSCAPTSSPHDTHTVGAMSKEAAIASFRELYSAIFKRGAQRRNRSPAPPGWRWQWPPNPTKVDLHTVLEWVEFFKGCNPAKGSACGRKRAKKGGRLREDVKREVRALYT